MTTLKGALEQMEKRLEAQGSQIQQIEGVISDHRDRVVALEAEVGLLEDQCKTLKAKVEEKENASRRQNLRVVGLPEGVECESATRYVSKMLEGLLEKGVLDKAPEVDRAHRSLRAEA